MKPPFLLIVEVFLYCQMVSVIFIRKSIPSTTKVLDLDDFQSFEYGMFDRVGFGHGFLGTLSFGISFSIGLPDNIVCLLAFSHIDVHEVFPS